MRVRVPPQAPVNELRASVVRATPARLGAGRVGGRSPQSRSRELRWSLLDPRSHCVRRAGRWPRGPGARHRRGKQRGGDAARRSHRLPRTAGSADTGRDLGRLSADSFVASFLDLQLSTYFEAVSSFESEVEQLEITILGGRPRSCLAELRPGAGVAGCERRVALTFELRWPAGSPRPVCGWVTVVIEWAGTPMAPLSALHQVA